MTGYDKKTVQISADKNVDITLQIDIDGTGVWVPYKTFELKGNRKITHKFDDAFSAYWVRAVSSGDAKATVWFTYE